MAILVKTANGTRWVEDAQWLEADHPRDEHGRFSSGGGSGGYDMSKFMRTPAEKRPYSSENLKEDLGNYGAAVEELKAQFKALKPGDSSTQQSLMTKAKNTLSGLHGVLERSAAVSTPEEHGKLSAMRYTLEYMSEAPRSSYFFG